MAANKFVMINNYLIDVSLSENHTFDAEVTDYPVESGGSISDNIRPKPITVSMEGIVSNTPIGEIVTQRAAQAIAKPDSSQSLAPFRISPTGEPSVVPAGHAYAFLYILWKSREPVTIRTSLDTFERMALTSLSIPRDAATGDALHFTAQFQQIQVVTNERIRKRTSLRSGTTGKKKDFGNKTSVIREQRLIIWHRGFPPGTDSHVTGSNSNGYKEVIWWLGKSGPTTQNEEGYFYADKVTPLVGHELWWFQQDMRRDRIRNNLRRYRNTTADQVAIANEDLIDSQLFGNDQRKTMKQPLQNMSDKARRTPSNAPVVSSTAPDEHPIETMAAGFFK
jgi:hypothetical protein